jgi:hypothetical protein
LLEFLRESLRLWSENVACVNTALRKGRGIENLKERLVGLYGIEEILLRDSPSRGDVSLASVSFLLSRPLTSQETRKIFQALTDVNRRFGVYLLPDASLLRNAKSQ